MTVQRGSEPQKRAYGKSHRDGKAKQDISHKYSHELHNAINKGKADATRDKFVDHANNFRMKNPATNRSVDRKIDNVFKQALDPKVKSVSAPSGVSTEATKGRFSSAVKAQKQSGALDNKTIFKAMTTIAKKAGFDRRQLNGSKHYGK